MGLNKNRLLTAGVLAALGVTAAPMISIWRQDASRTFAPVPTANVAIPGIASSDILVDLQDNASDADIADIETRLGIDLKFNSVEGEDDKLMRATIPAGRNISDLLSRLKSDSRVEVAEPDQIFSIPEQDSATGQAVATVVAEGGLVREAVVRSSQIQVQLNPARVREVRGMSSILTTSEPGNRTVKVVYTLSPEVPTNSWRMHSPEPSNGFYWGFATGGNPWNRNAFVPNDPRYNEQWNFRMIDVEGAWAKTRGKGVVVAVIDTGVNIGPTKKGKASKDFGVTKFVEGYDFVNKDKDPYDDHGHGTHVAGTIAESTNNSEGVAGIAFEATIMPLKVLSASGSGSAGDIADAIRFAADKGAHVINMSLGSSMPSDVIRKACQYARKKGVVIVCAAGNSFREGVGYPAAFPECIAVSSVGPSGDLAKYSSWGKEVALAAPGGDYIDSGNKADGILQNTNIPESQGGNGDDYYAFQGTSMASPHVAGVAALIVSQGVNDPARVREVLTQTASPKKGDVKKYGAGILSASGAVKKSAETSAVKLRHLLVFGLGFLLFAVGGRGRNPRLRLAMAGALVLGFFGPDWAASWFGADTAWNLLTFSALAPIALYSMLRGGPGVKVAGVLGLAVGVCLFANWWNGTLPFTTASFGTTPLLWTGANAIAAFGVAFAAARKAHRATNR